jgi:hypothetical protein
MSTFNSKFIIILICVLASCTTNNETTPEAQTPIQDYTNNALILIQDSGIKSLKAEKAPWEVFHQNYIEVTSKYENHPNLNAYISSLIYHQILKTSILEEVNSENYSILETYLMELRSLTNPYTKINYLIIDALTPYLERNKLQEIAKISIDKAMNKQQIAKEELEGMQEKDEFEIELKKKLQGLYNEEYHVFLPKLKDFIASTE